jgi:hypothetical protein
MIACEEALSGASHITVLPVSRSFRPRPPDRTEDPPRRRRRRNRLCRQRPSLSPRRPRCARLAAGPPGRGCGSWIVADGTVRGHDRCPIGFRGSLSMRGTCDNERLFVARYCRFRCHTSIENAQELVTRSGLSRRRPNQLTVRGSGDRRTRAENPETTITGLSLPAAAWSLWPSPNLLMPFLRDGCQFWSAPLNASF